MSNDKPTTATAHNAPLTGEIQINEQEDDAAYAVLGRPIERMSDTTEVDTRTCKFCGAQYNASLSTFWRYTLYATRTATHGEKCPIVQLEHAHPRGRYENRRIALELLLEGKDTATAARAAAMSQAMVRVYQRELHALGAVERSLSPIERERAAKNAAYTERNRLVALLTALFPSSLERHQPEDDPNWEPDWKNVVYIDLPTGQAGWHIHDSELPLFDHIPGDQGRKWDGHTTKEKYQRIAGLGVQLRSPEVSDLLFRLRVTLQQTLNAKLALSQDCWRCRYCGGQRWEPLTRQDDLRYDPDQAPMFCRECGAQMQYMRWDDASQTYVLSNVQEECARIFGTAEAKESEAPHEP